MRRTMNLISSMSNDESSSVEMRILRLYRSMMNNEMLLL